VLDTKCLLIWKSHVYYGTMARILFVGYATMDTIHGKNFLGGAAGAMSINATQLGIESSLLAPLSTDTLGKKYTSALKKCGVSLELCDFESPSIPTCHVIDPFGLGSTRDWKDNGAFEHFVSEMMAQVSEKKLAKFDYIFLCNAPKEVCQKIATTTTTRNILYIPGPKTVSTANWVTPKVLDKTLILFGNEEESPVLWDTKPFEHGVELAVMTAGSKGGSVYFKDEQSEKIERKTYTASKLSSMVDTTGAGDTFALGFAKAWLENHDISKVISFAKKLTTQNLQTMGAVLPRKEV